MILKVNLILMIFLTHTTSRVLMSGPFVLGTACLRLVSGFPASAPFAKRLLKPLRILLFSALRFISSDLFAVLLLTLASLIISIIVVYTLKTPIQKWRQTLYDFNQNGYSDIAIINDIIVAFTDGACTNQANPAIRHAGFGVWFNDNHPSNISAHLPGVEQTSIRAELYAAMCDILVTSNSLIIKTVREVFAQ